MQYMITPTELVPNCLPVVPEPARSKQNISRALPRCMQQAGRPSSTAVLVVHT